MIQSEMLSAMIVSASNHLQNNRKTINDMNVFPVPDGDTGTNMGMTFGAVAKAVTAEDSALGCGAMMDMVAKSALRNARGNSGVILSQILRGLATAVAGAEELDTESLKAAACQARDTAYRAVMKPTEGTILTVVRETAEFAEAHAEEYTDTTAFFGALLGAAKASLATTPEILPVLKQAGVVDAGGLGVVTLLEGAYMALDGKAAVLAEGVTELEGSGSKLSAVATEEIKFLYCTEFLIQKSAERKTTQFRAAIESKGDCMLVIEDEEVVKVHIHTNHPGYVIEQALKLGELTNLKIDNMKYQHEERIQTEDGTTPSERKKFGFVAVSAGDGLTEVFADIGADAVVEGGQTMNPSTQDLLNAVQKIQAETVFILPNNKNIILAAEQVNELAECRVIVIPTKNIPQGISAMLAFDEDATADENRDAMCEMMETVACGQITFAARNSTVDGMKISKGDIMGMVGSSIKHLGSDINAVAESLIDDMISEESGVISIYYGAETDKALAEELEQKLAKKYQYLDVSLIYGGQPVYYYFLAVE